MILGTKEKARPSCAHTLYRGIVARRDSMSEAGETPVESGADRRFSWGIPMLRGYGSMTFFPIVLLVAFATVSLQKPPIMATTLDLDRPCAKTRDNPPPLGKSSAETANNGDHAFLGSRCRQTQRDPATGLGKSPAEAANHGQFALLNPYRAKTPNRLGKNPAETAYHGDSQEQRR